MIRKKSKSGRRSPLQEHPLPSPGDSLHEALVEVALVQRMPWVIASVAAGLLAALEWFRWYGSVPPVPVPATVIAVILLIVTASVWRRTNQKVHSIRLGMEGEIAVGQHLEQLRSEGFEVFHDIVEGEFNIDHVLVGPPGVFVVETKTLSKIDGIKNKITWHDDHIRVNGYIPDRDAVG